MTSNLPSNPTRILLPNHAITREDPEAWLDRIWGIIHFYADEGLAIQHDSTDPHEVTAEWDDICTMMAWLREDLLSDGGESQ